VPCRKLTVGYVQCSSGVWLALQTGRTGSFGVSRQGREKPEAPTQTGRALLSEVAAAGRRSCMPSKPLKAVRGCGQDDMLEHFRWVLFCTEAAGLLRCCQKTVGVCGDRTGQGMEASKQMREGEVLMPRGCFPSFASPTVCLSSPRASPLCLIPDLELLFVCPGRSRSLEQFPRGGRRETRNSWVSRSGVLSYEVSCAKPGTHKQCDLGRSRR
jgi:hypothetical protein